MLGSRSPYHLYHGGDGGPRKSGTMVPRKRIGFNQRFMAIDKMCSSIIHGCNHGSIKECTLFSSCRIASCMGLKQKRRVGVSSCCKKLLMIFTPFSTKRILLHWGQGNSQHSFGTWWGNWARNSSEEWEKSIKLARWCVICCFISFACTVLFWFNSNKAFRILDLVHNFLDAEHHKETRVTGRFASFNLFLRRIVDNEITFA